MVLSSGQAEVANPGGGVFAGSTGGPARKRPVEHATLRQIWCVTFHCNAANPITLLSNLQACMEEIGELSCLQVDQVEEAFRTISVKTDRNNALQEMGQESVPHHVQA